MLLSAYVSCDTGLANVTSPRRNSPDGEARCVTTQVNLHRALGLIRSNNQLAIPKKLHKQWQQSSRSLKVPNHSVVCWHYYAKLTEIRPGATRRYSNRNSRQIQGVRRLQTPRRRAFQRRRGAVLNALSRPACRCSRPKSRSSQSSSPSDLFARITRERT